MMSYLKLYKCPLIERVMRAVDAINVLDVFCSCYTVISAVSQAKHSSAALPCKRARKQFVRSL